VLSVGVDSGFDHSKLTGRQRLNHFPRHMELTRKDLMVKNLKKWKRAMAKAGKPVSEFWPVTYRLPEAGPFSPPWRLSAA
jgi:Tubulin-tyrosine ligase family